jgi:uncharacterized membrane protein YhaH (DUF805 family)
MSLLKLLFSFNGRIGRAEYWFLQIVFWVVLISLIYGLGSLFPPDRQRAMIYHASVAGRAAAEAKQTLIVLVAFIVAVPIWLASHAKRLHDLGRTGLWMFLVLIPILGLPFVSLACGFLSGQKSDNEYGERPRSARRVAAQDAAPPWGCACGSPAGRPIAPPGRAAWRRDGPATDRSGWKQVAIASCE